MKKLTKEKEDALRCGITKGVQEKLNNTRYARKIDKVSEVLFNRVEIDNFENKSPESLKFFGYYMARNRAVYTAVFLGDIDFIEKYGNGPSKVHPRY